MAFEHLEVSIEGSIAWVWLNRPDAANAYSESMVRDLPSVLGELDRDQNVRVVVLGARGKVFCAGGDIKAMRGKTGMFAGGPNELRERYMDGIQQIPLSIMRLRKPLLAMIHGAAVGAGCDLVAMADLRLASVEATFAETFAKVGLVPGDGGAWFLARAVGHSKASEMFLTGKTYDAREAQAMGLVHEVILSDQLVRRAKELAEQLAGIPPIALQLTKKSLQHAYESGLQQHLDMVAAFQGITQNSSDHLEALVSSGERRAAIYKHV